MDVKAVGKRDTEDFVELSAEHLTPEEIVSHLRKAEGVISSDLTKVNSKRVVGTIKTHDCPVCRSFAGLNCFLVSASTREKGKMEWRLFVGAEGELKRLCRRLDRNHVGYRITEITRHFGKREITPRQEELLRIAFDLGFFEFPKRITLEELANKFGLSMGTLSEILRRAEKNILGGYFSTTQRE